MNSFPLKRLGFLTFAFMLCLQCSPKIQTVSTSEDLFCANIPANEQSLEIIRLEEIVKNSPKTYTSVHRAMFQLAILYSHPDNPSPNYQASLKMLKMYLEHGSDKERRDIASYLVPILTRILELNLQVQKGDERTQTLRQEKRTLQEANRKLLEESKEMKETLEKLKALDLQLDEQRKQIR